MQLVKGEREKKKFFFDSSWNFHLGRRNGCALMGGEKNKESGT